MSRQSCRHTDRIIDRLTEDQPLSAKHLEHIAACARCTTAAELTAWLETSLPRLMPTLAAEPIPAGVTDSPAVMPPRFILHRGRRPLLAMASVAAVTVAAVIVGSQLAVVIGPERAGNIPGANNSATPSESTIPSERQGPAPTEPPVGGNCASSGAGATFDPRTPEEDIEVLNGLPRVLIERHGTTVVSLFASRNGDGQASVLCMWFTEQSPPVVASGSGFGAEFPADGPLRLFAASRGASPDERHTAYAGSVDPSIVRVEVERNEGAPVTASVADGYFLASWPGDAYATRFVGYGATDDVIATIGNNGWDLNDSDGE